MSRQALMKASRLVVKLGTGVLTDERKQPNAAQMQPLVDQVAELRRDDREVVMVTSGAVGAGMGALGFAKRPAELAELQACAAVGQSRLMAMYERLFARHGLAVAQVLLTHDDLEHHDRHLNARNTLVALLKRQVVPIINENDAVSSTELRFGDNDKLSALVACLLPADLLVVLTTVDGVIENYGRPDARVLHTVDRIDSHLEKMAGGTESATAVGGMSSKIQAAKITVRAGIPLVIASGKKPGTLGRIVRGEGEGTLFVPHGARLKSRKRWIAFFHHPKGTLFVDSGAKHAVREHGKSLLLPGLRRCEGSFGVGDVVGICDTDGTEFARGIAAVSADSLRDGEAEQTVIVHRNNLVIL